MIPKKLFLTKGMGVDKNKLFSFELALRDAGIEKCNLVPVSSIFPPGCKIIEKEKGEKYLKAGEITYCVMAKNQTSDNKLISASIGLAFPKNFKNHGYLFENYAYGDEAEKCGTEAENLAEKMLLTHSNNSQNKFSKEDIFKTNICQIAEGEENLWTTAIAIAIFIG